MSASCGWPKKVIIETADLAPSLGVNDPILELFADPALGVQGILVAPAIHQSEILRSINQHIKNLPIIGTIISLTSEAVSLGGVLDTLILGELPLIGITQQPDGAIQRVTAGGLINCAKRLARKIGRTQRCVWHVFHLTDCLMLIRYITKGGYKKDLICM